MKFYQKSTEKSTKNWSDTDTKVITRNILEIHCFTKVFTWNFTKIQGGSTKLIKAYRHDDFSNIYDLPKVVIKKKMKKSLTLVLEY